LEKRKLVHLKKYVYWSKATDEHAAPERDDDIPRSKFHVGRIKSALNMFVPESMNIVVKNEAHARFLNAMWYSCSATRFTAFGITVVALTIILCKLVWPPGPLQDYFRSNIEIAIAIRLIIVSIVFVLLSIRIRKMILDNFHYLRVREIIFILQSAHDTELLFGDDQLFEILDREAE